MMLYLTADLSAQRRLSMSRMFSASPRRRGTFRPQLEALEDRLTPGGLSGAAPPVLGPDMAASQQNGAIITTSPVVLFSDHSVVVGESTVMRTENGITAHLTATGLAPGVYTFWMKVDVPGVGTVAGRLAGHVVGQDGILDFSAHVSVGEVLSGHPTFASGPLQDPLHATITLVVRAHGPADPGRIYEQTHTFEPATAVNYLISIHAPPP
jgi:hypothetical protein